MYYRTFFPRDVFAELDRLQRDMQQAYDPSIRGGLRGGFPAMNVGSTPKSVEIYAFAPGVDPAGSDSQTRVAVAVAAAHQRCTRQERDVSK